MFEDAGLLGDDDQHDAAGTPLDGLRLKPAQRFEYLFDFGDSWLHEVSVEAIGSAEPGARYGVIDKKGSSPPQYEGVDE